MSWTSLICASKGGHLDVVKRLLDHKEIDVNLQSKVSRMLISLHRISPSLPYFFFFDAFFLMNIFVDGKKKCRMERPH